MSPSTINPHPSTNMNHIGIIIKAAGVFKIDNIKVEKIVLDNQAHRLLLLRANQDGTTLNEAFEKTLVEAVREFIDKNPLA